MSRIALYCCSLVSAVLISGLVFAHSGATGVIKTRMDAMSDIAKSMKTIGIMIKGQSEFNPETVSAAASVIQNHAATMLPLFPENTITHPSEALPSIWQNWKEFSELTRQMETGASSLTGDARSLDELKPRFAKLAKTCSACHEKFRLKK